jgi:hypothetical protein
MYEVSAAQRERFELLLGRHVEVTTKESRVLFKAPDWRRNLARRVPIRFWRVQGWLLGDIDFEDDPRTGRGQLTGLIHDDVMADLVGGEWIAVMLDDKWFCFLHDSDEITELA